MSLHSTEDTRHEQADTINSGLFALWGMQIEATHGLVLHSLADEVTMTRSSFVVLCQKEAAVQNYLSIARWQHVLLVNATLAMWSVRLASVTCHECVTAFICDDEQ